jgi:ribonuclease BN (tRNA processing enzyme)
MMPHKLLGYIVLSLSLFFSTQTYAQTQCLDKHYTLQVLGSGGPMSEGRASSGYIVWLKGKPRFLIDTGGGVFLRFGEAGGTLDDLDLIALSHFHTDHSADFPAIMKNGYFSSRTRSLKVSGPSGSDQFPGLYQFIQRMFNAKDGAFQYLNGYLTGTGGLFKLEQQEVSIANTTTPVIVYQDNEVTVSALSVPHGIVPAVAHRIDTPDGRIVISTDQNGHNPAFVEFSKNADILVMPMAIPENSSQNDQTLHIKPDLIGKIAEDSQARMLVLAHFMGPTLRYMEDNIKIIQETYKGPVFASRDLACYPVTKGEHHE